MMKTRELLIAIDGEKDRQKLKKYTLCRLAGVSARHYERALQGDTSMKPEKLEALCKVLGLSLTICLHS